MDKVKLLREQIKAVKLDAYIIPNNDEFGNEYLPPAARRLEFLTGFTGSAGTTVIGQKKAAFFTDGRYILQAHKQLDKKVFEVFNISEKTPQLWVQKNNLRTGFDPLIFSASAAKKFPQNFTPLAANLIDKIWKNKPQNPNTKAQVLPLKFAGEKWQQKVARLSKKLNADFALITSPDSVNWLFNIRGGDIPNTPFCLAYAALRKNGKPVLFIDSAKITAEIRKHLVGVEIKNLSLAEIQKTMRRKNVFLDPNRTPFAIYSALQKTCKISEGADVCLMPKSIKNKTEISGIKNAHELDGIAVTKFLSWLTKNSVKLDELTATEKLENFRKENKEYISPSFDTIAGFGSNGAIVHYRATAKSNKKFASKNLFLLDSGGQYLGNSACGTTDITRTIAIGKPTKEMKRNYTLVLKGHIAIATAKFPRGTSGAQLDALARQFLWAEGKDYDHGTGHGVGCYLSVHEGPCGISKRYSDTALQAGMVLSNEPGFYKAGEYGIRIENLVLVVEGKNNFLQFETLTKAPLDENLIEWELLTAKEKNWINSYHENISSRI